MASNQIMISYQWDNQSEVTEIKEALIMLGYNVWMDVDNMRGNIYEKMAEGVENSALIILCMSKKYEDSVNCQKEFLYSQDKRKPIIPLIMESKYRPGGALGLIISGKKYVNFSDFKFFDEKMIELQDELQAFFESDAPPVQEMKAVGFSHSESGHFMKIGFVSARGNSWNGAADSIIGKIRGRRIKRDQLVCIDAHNNGKDEKAIFAAFFDLNSPGDGELVLAYDHQNTTSGWYDIYSQAKLHAESVKLEDVVGMTASCNSNGHGVFYVFSQVPSPRSSHCTVNFVEARGDWEDAADQIITLLADAGAQNGQVLKIDVHNNGEGTEGIVSAFWSPDLPVTGALSIGYKHFSGGSAWTTFYGNCGSACNELKRSAFISITGSIDTPDISVMFLFYYQ